MMPPLFSSSFLEMGPTRSLMTPRPGQIADLQDRYRQYKSSRPMTVYRTIGYTIDNLVPPSLFLEQMNTASLCSAAASSVGIDIPAAASSVGVAVPPLATYRSAPLLYKRVSGWTKRRGSASSTQFYTYFNVISMIVDPKDVIVDLDRVGIRETEEVLIAPGSYRCTIIRSSRFPRPKVAKEIGYIYKLLRTDRYVKIRESHGVTLTERDLSHTYQNWRLVVDPLAEEIVLKDLRSTERGVVVFRFGDVSKTSPSRDDVVSPSETRGGLIDLFERCYSEVISSVTFGLPIFSSI